MLDSVKDKLSIQILDRQYPVEVEEGNVEAFRALVKDLNQRLNLFKNQYSNKDKQDSLAMVALQLAVELADLKIQQKSMIKTQEVLDDLDTILNELV